MHHSALKKRRRLRQAVIKKAIEWGKPLPPHRERIGKWVDLKRSMALAEAIEALVEHIEKYGKDAREE